jgi:hypothetical protein
MNGIGSKDLKEKNANPIARTEGRSSLPKFIGIVACDKNVMNVGNLQSQ